MFENWWLYVGINLNLNKTQWKILFIYEILCHMYKYLLALYIADIESGIFIITNELILNMLL